ncbi:MAG: rod shape-determining protein RodA [Candidatus Moranbacteria bacterium CG06_land_8_20_14_3_00_40_12]|nr:MAG: rod shape-determining protein RodA [Candidatus Moranbacteria bacterium CG23_combo_of_CG06-09_8_20_14_all_40_16]PIU80382.1 MAG: rod shape-determining protein RodA [Candidatus Moranbacteria bacterium CG06_land_8_20_14_3_00_40_12]
MVKILKLDWLMLVVALLLLTIGLAALYSVSFSRNEFNSEYFVKQIIAILIGIGIMFLLALYDYRAFGFFSTRLYLITVLILFGVIYFGVEARGTTGWFGISGFNFQPVELTKLVMIIFLANFLSKKKNELSIWVKIFSSTILIFIPVFLILKQPDFGSAIIIIGIWLGMFLVSGIDKKNLIIFVSIILVAFFSSWLFLRDYQKDRIKNFINPYNDPRGSGYNVIQSIVAVGSGGVWGKGLGHGSQSQLNFLPEKHTDFIFAAIGEELGFWGSALVLGLFGVLLYQMKNIARFARDNVGYLMSVGIMIMFILQIFINIGMNIGIAPIAGVPLPLLSYGGSSIIIMLASLGILQSIYIRKIKTLD